MAKNPRSPNTPRILAVLGLTVFGLALTATSYAAAPSYFNQGMSTSAVAGAAVPDVDAKIAELQAEIDGLLEPAEWLMKTDSSEVTSNTVYKLCNSQSGECLGWQKHLPGLGINLGWFKKSADKQARLVKQDGGTVKYGDTIALFVGQTADSYLCYAKRPVGINLEFSTKPCYQWRIDPPAEGVKAGRALRGNDHFVLTNLTVNDTMVRCARSNSGFQGAWLKWGTTCTKAELAYTNKSLYEQLLQELKALVG